MGRPILIVDDDVSLTEILGEYLTQNQFECHVAHNASQALALLKEITPVIVLLDVMLPEKTGIELCREIRLLTDVPVLMLTAQGRVADKVKGLGAGADDYVTKPFEPPELIARIDAILRRPRLNKAIEVLKSDGLELNLGSREAFLHGKSVDLTEAEFDVLVFLFSHPGVAYNREDIAEQVASLDSKTQSRTVDVILSRLRSKLDDDPKAPRYIKTVRGSGYLFLRRDKPN